jgi:hypothetical protein
MSFIAPIFIFCIIISGTIGNLLSLLVWSVGQRCSKTSGAVLFKLLSTIDLIILVINGTEYTLRTGFEIFIQDYNDIICRLFFFVDDFMPQLSAWIAVLLTVERMINICFPLKFYNSNTRKRSYVALVIIMAASFCLNILSLIAPALVHIADDYDYIILEQNETFVFCDFAYEYKDIHYTVSTISFVVFTFLLPFTLIVSCNVFTLMTLHNKKEEFPSNKTRQQSVLNLTKIVIFVGALHCLSTMPRGIHWFLLRIGTYIPNQYDWPLEDVANVCYFLNSGFNYVFYCVFGNQFRVDLQELVCLCFRKRQLTTTEKKEAKS